jgi:hypothetical protein
MRKLAAVLFLFASLPARAPTQTCTRRNGICASFGNNRLVFGGRVLERMDKPTTASVVTYPDGIWIDNVNVEANGMQGQSGHEVYITSSVSE